VGVTVNFGKDVTTIVSTTPGANLPPVSTMPVVNKPPMLLTLVVHLYLQIYPQIFETIGIVRGEGKMSHEKNLKQKSRSSVPLKLLLRNSNFLL
jgi:hypothetical protein